MKMIAKSKTSRLWLFVAAIAGIAIAGCAHTAAPRQVERLYAMQDETADYLNNEVDHYNQLGNEYIAMIENPSPDTTDAKLARKLDQLHASHDAIQKRMDELTRAYNDYLSHNPNDITTRDHYANFLADWDLDDEAIAQWQEIIKRDPKYALAYNNIAVLYTHMGKDLEAADLIRKAIALDPNDAEFYCNLSSIYDLHRDEIAARYNMTLPQVFQAVVEMLDRARKLDPDNLEYAREYAREFVMAKHYNLDVDYDAAIEGWRCYLGLDLTDEQRVFGLNNMAMMMVGKGDKADAIQTLRESIAIHSSIMATDLLKRCEDQPE
jgi:tetratricopeptide (TPR) repeat protein